MKELGYIEIRVNEVSPNAFDISDVMELLKNAENLLYPNERKSRPIISYEIKEGEDSTRNLIKTLIGPVKAVNAVLGQIQNDNSIDLIDTVQAKAIENMQEWAVKKKYELVIKTSVKESAFLGISQHTKYYRSENLWLDSDLYLYGKVTNMGGKTSPNLHLATDDYGTVIIQTTEEILANEKENKLYKLVGVHVQAKQNVKSGQLDKNEVKLLDFVDYKQEYDSDYLNELINQAGKTWADIPDTDQWLAQIRENIYV
jgi:hypothetical protein